MVADVLGWLLTTQDSLPLHFYTQARRLKIKCPSVLPRILLWNVSSKASSLFLLSSQCTRAPFTHLKGRWMKHTQKPWGDVCWALCAHTQQVKEVTFKPCPPESAGFRSARHVCCGIIVDEDPKQLARTVMICCFNLSGQHLIHSGLQTIIFPILFSHIAIRISDRQKF